MKRMLFYSALACLLSLSACSSFKKSNTAQNTGPLTSTVITDKKWKLIELKGSPVPNTVNGKDPFILLQTSDQRYSATA
ncbi:MAG TPA: hypothetical protein VL092_01980, partial [Chitinophagaceae bacterium]|nr:hypothetical protein [Chitinophagaceae bacterium]